MAGTNVEEYNRSRAALIAQERSLRCDYLRLGALSDLEARAEQRIREIRKLEEQTVWSTPGDLFPGMEFLTAKQTIQQTRLFKILKRMPKGALLHAHMDAMSARTSLLGLRIF